MMYFTRGALKFDSYTWECYRTSSTAKVLGTIK
jgi:hypothetical protein